MHSPWLLALVHLVMVTHIAPKASPQPQPQKQTPPPEQPAATPKPIETKTKEPAPAETAAKEPSAKDPAEKVLAGTDEATLWITSKKPRVKVETHRGVSFDIDFATHGALSLAHISAELNTEPKGLVLPFAQPGGTLTVDYDKEKQELLIMIRGSKEPLAKFPLKISATAPTRVLLRQRQQLALFVVPPDGGHPTLAWLGGVNYVVIFRNAAQYELCKNLKITMGKREITPEELRSGVHMEALDEIGDVSVSGTSPRGEAFRHRYTFDYNAMVKLTDSAYGSFMKAAGNPQAEDESTQVKSKTLDGTQ